MLGQYMDVPPTLAIASLLFVVAAGLMGGLLMALHMRADHVLPPMAISILHMLLAVSAVGSYAAILLYGGINLLSGVVLALFLTAAGFGLYIFASSRRLQQPAPMSLVLTHVIFAFTAISLFFLAVFTVGGAAGGGRKELMPGYEKPNYEKSSELGRTNDVVTKVAADGLFHLGIEVLHKGFGDLEPGSFTLVQRHPLG